MSDQESFTPKAMHDRLGEFEIEVIIMRIDLIFNNQWEI
jgi:hypothetical protein